VLPFGFCVVPALGQLGERESIGGVAVDLVGAHEDEGSLGHMAAHGLEQVECAHCVSCRSRQTAYAPRGRARAVPRSEPRHPGESPRQRPAPPDDCGCRYRGKRNRLPVAPAMCAPMSCHRPHRRNADADCCRGQPPVALPGEMHHGFAADESTAAGHQDFHAVCSLDHHRRRRRGPRTAERAPPVWPCRRGLSSSG